jgi:hypothetical protein
MTILRSRSPEELHTVASDDSDTTLMALCLPTAFNVRISAKHENLSTRAVSQWVEAFFRESQDDATATIPSSADVHVDSLKRVSLGCACSLIKLLAAPILTAEGSCLQKKVT